MGPPLTGVVYIGHVSPLLVRGYADCPPGRRICLSPFMKRLYALFHLFVLILFVFAEAVLPIE